MAVPSHRRLVHGDLERRSGALKDLSHAAVGAGEHQIEKSEAGAAQRAGPVAVGEELVEDRDPPTRTQHPGGFTQAAHRIGDDLQDHVQDRRVEGGVGQIESVAVHHPQLHVRTGAPLCLPQHGRRQIGGQHTDALRDQRQVGAGAAADDDQALARPQVEKLERAAALRMELGHPVVMGRPERVAEELPGVRGHGVSPPPPPPAPPPGSCR